MVAFSSIAKDAKIRDVALEEIQFARVLSSKYFIKIATIPMITIKWNLKLADSIVALKRERIKRLDLKGNVIRYTFYKKRLRL